jgi:hypothetical protein
MVLRNVSTGAFFAYDISNNQITSAAGMGQIAMDWQLGGLAANASASAASTSDATQVSQLVQGIAGFGGGAAESFNSAPLGADASQQMFLTSPQHG